MEKLQSYKFCFKAHFYLFWQLYLHLRKSQAGEKYSFLSERSEARQKIILPLLPPIHLNFVWPICCSLTPVTKTKKEPKSLKPKNAWNRNKVIWSFNLCHVLKFEWNEKYILGSGGGSAGRAVASFTRGPQFISHPRHNRTIFYQLQLTKVKNEWKKELRISHH